MSQPVIKVDRLTKRFDDTTAVDAISFAISAGTVAGLLGGNGAGKTTTISMLLGLLLPTAGTIEVLGVDMLRHRHRVLPRMNFSSPYVDLPHRLTVAENLTVYGHLYGLSHVRNRVAEIAEALDIAQFLKRPVGSLSAGQKTRVALAKALLNKPGCAAAGRAHRLARPRHGGLGPDISGDLPARRPTPPSCWPPTTCWRSSGCAASC